MNTCSPQSRPARAVLTTALLAVTLTSLPGASDVAAQQPAGISTQALAQIDALAAEKAVRTPAQRKISSQLLYAAKMARGEAIAVSVPTLDAGRLDVDAGGVVLDVRTEVGQAVLDQFVALGARILDVDARHRNVRLRIDLSQVEALAAIPQVSFVQPKQEALTSRMDAPGRAGPLAERLAARSRRPRMRERGQTLASLQRVLQRGVSIPSVGSEDSEGDAKHSAAAARLAFGVDGTGVKIGVLSDGVENLAASQALGDLGAVTVLPGQAGEGDEGTAMLEIIHDLAPGAELYFATAFTSIGSFATNIRALQAAGCDVIVDDVSYFAETPFQDGQTTASQTNGGVVIQAVKDVTAAGALFFSSAANSGNQNDGTSGTWEGDFVDGGDATGILAGAGRVHDFGGQSYDALTVATPNPISLHWSDPLGGSGNDYDLYLLNSTGTAILAASTNSQTGTQDPFELMSGGSAGQRIVIVKWSGSARFLHLATNRGRLGISTAGETHGHAATSAPNSFGVAATFAQVNGPNPFNNAHVVETFSSDGPRRIFFRDDGTAITPGNVSSSGGQLLQKPDFTAADGVSVTGVGGFPSPFFGTSAAAPHAAAIAGLVKSKYPSLTGSQIRNALLATAIDIEAPGVDRDSGYGILMADGALAAATPVPTSTGDAYATAYQTPLTVPAPGVLANDHSSGGGPMTAVLVSNPAHGSLLLDPDGGFVYTPNDAFIGNDGFTYRALNEGGLGNVVAVTIAVAPPPTPPQAPTGLYTASIVGNSVTLRWTPAPVGPAATAFVVEGGVTPGGVLASLSTGGTAPAFTFTAPSGSFFVRVHQISGAARSPASNEIVLHVNAPVPPSPPSGLLATVNGSALTLAWRRTFAGGSPTSLLLDVTGSLAGSIPLAATDQVTFPVVPNGTYTLSLRAQNAAGASAPSAPVTIAVPGACTGAPHAPTNFVFYKTGGVVTALWDPASTGAAPSGYAIGVTGTYTLGLPTSQRGISASVPPGTYTMSVTATNACGASAPTAALTVNVP